jgi:hypothetical protein
MCTVDLDTGNMSFHASTEHPNNVLVLSETEKVTFVLDPTPEHMEYQISIGDVPLSDLVSVPDDAGGRDIGGRLIWHGMGYFESARGRTLLLLEARPAETTTAVWKTVAVVDIYVLPTKLGDERYENMTEDLASISRGLLVDLYGKSRETYDLRYAQEGRIYTSRETELASITDALDQFFPLLAAIQARPASRVVSEPCLQKYWGSERISPSTISAMSRSGISPQHANRPLLIRGRKKVESFDIPEHRVFHAFLKILAHRARYCARAARGHIDVLTSERHLRHIQRGNEPSLYERIDLPKIRRLEQAIDRAVAAMANAESLLALPFLARVPAELVAVQGGGFQRSPEYRQSLSVIRSFLLKNAIWYEGDEVSAITKLTSRLFEQWCYLKLVEAFRCCGLELREWTDVIRNNLASRFIIDFDRGLAFEGTLAPGLRLRFRYEPWILGKNSAVQAKETLCRGSANTVAWSPDIVLECLRWTADAWKPIYVIVLDCKYRIRNVSFDEISKYSEIRCTETMRQLVKQLWLITLPEPQTTPSINSEDPAILFEADGPTCDASETVRFRFSIQPEDKAQPDLFKQFAQGTIRFLRRHHLQQGQANE